jgi:hypothetical protein
VRGVGCRLSAGRTIATTNAEGSLVEHWKSQNGRHSGDPATLARALITIASQELPPRRFIAGADAIATTEQKIADLKTQIDANRGPLHVARFY